MKIHFNLHESLEKLQSNGKYLVITFIATLILMVVACVVVFFAMVTDKEQVMVPDVIGLPLEDALLEMQVKELYPKIQLHYSNTPSDKGTILSQDPSEGTIVKAGRRINLIVSRGVVIDKIENYVGMTLDDVRIRLQTLFAGSSRALIVLAEPMYEYSDEVPAGVIIQQDPAEGTEISDTVSVNLVVSRGHEYEKAKIPNLVGLSINDTLLQMSRSKLVFSFKKAEPDATDELSDASNVRIAAVKSQRETPGEEVSIYTRISVEIVMPEEEVDGLVYGIFETELQWYPYALPVLLEALTPDGERYTIVDFNYTGGPLTIPYAVPRNTVLILSVSGQEQLRKTVE